jgi:hypothetical protein
MSRDSGFPRADVDVRILDDPKFRAIIRSTRDDSVIARCVTAYLAILTASWARGERVSLEDAAPLWVTGLDDLGDRLSNIGLLDAEHRIPEHTWASWYEPARARRERLREGGRKGGLAHRDPDPTKNPVPDPVPVPVPVPKGLSQAEGRLKPGLRPVGTTTNEGGRCARCGRVFDPAESQIAFRDPEGDVAFYCGPCDEVLRAA